MRVLLDSAFCITVSFKDVLAQAMADDRQRRMSGSGQSNNPGLQQQAQIAGGLAHDNVRYYCWFLPLSCLCSP